MKKLIAVLLFTLMIVSCTAGEEIDIEVNLETYQEAFAEENAANEMPYIPPEEDTIVNVIYAEDYIIHDGKYYFEIKHAFDIGGGVRMLAYVDIAAGTYGIVCQDHLCPHNDPKVCKYADLGYYSFTDKPGVFYAVRMTSDMQLCRVDLNEDVVENICKLDYFGWELLGYSDGRMYFCETEYTVTEDKKTVSKAIYYYIDDATREIVKIDSPENEWTYSHSCPRFVYDGKFYIFTDNKIIRTDPSFEKNEEIADFGMPIDQWYMDTGTGEIYFSCIDRNNRTGSVYVIKDNIPEKVNLPHDEVYTFTVTHEKIYYTVYDPVYLGISAQASYAPSEEAENHKTYDYTGGKLYSVDRNNPSVAEEMVYEVKDIPLDKAVMLESAVVIGNYLYIDEINVLREVRQGKEYVSFDYSRDVSKIRIGLKDGSFTRISFE